jgi:hypothetical protein
VIADLRCELCGLLFWIQDLVVSSRFPINGARFVCPELRGACYKAKALEVADSFHRAIQGGPGPPRTEDKGKPLVVEPKAKPPVKAEEPATAAAPTPKQEESPKIRQTPTRRKKKQSPVEKKRREESERRNQEESPVVQQEDIQRNEVELGDQRTTEKP